MFFRKFFSFRGRISRSEYFWRHLAVVVFPLLSMIVGSALLLTYVGADYLLSAEFFLLWPCVAVVLCALWSSTALSVRRLHDLGRSGWFLVLGFSFIPLSVFFEGTYIAVTVVGGMFNIYLFFFKGTVGPNRYGDDPLEKHSKTKIDSNI